MRYSGIVVPMKLLLRAGLNAAIVFFTFQLVPGLSVEDNWAGLAIVVVMLGLANAFVRPILKLLALPIRLATLGLFTLVINVVIVFGVMWLAEEYDLGLSSDGWIPQLIGAAIISVATSIVSSIVKE